MTARKPASVFMTKDGMQHGDQRTALGKQYLPPAVSGFSETCVHVILCRIHKLSVDQAN